MLSNLLMSSEKVIEKYLFYKKNPIDFISDKFFAKCITHYVGIVSNISWSNVRLRDFQKSIVKDIFKYDRNIVLKSRQSGISLTFLASAFYYSLFNKDTNITFFYNSLDMAYHNSKYMYSIFKKSEFGDMVYKYNKSVLKLKNGSNMYFKTINQNNFDMSYEYHLTYIDEASFSNQTKLMDLYDNVNIQSNKIVIASSLNNEHDYFYEMYLASKNNENDFNANEIYWWQIPGRDAKWANLEKRSIGEKAFNRQYNLKF